MSEDEPEVDGDEAESDADETYQHEVLKPPQFQVANAKCLVLIVGVLAIAVGFLRILHLLPLSPWITLVFGVVFCVLAHHVGRQKRGALLAALLLLGGGALWHIASIVWMMENGDDPLNLGVAAVECGLFIAMLFVYRRTPAPR